MILNPALVSFISLHSNHSIGSFVGARQEDSHSGNTANAFLFADLRSVIHVHFDHQHFAFEFVGKLLERAGWIAGITRVTGIVL